MPNARRILRRLLDRTVQHQSPSAHTVDGGGGRTPTYAVANADVPAAIWPMTANAELSEAFDRMDIVTTHAICTNSDLAAKAKDLIVDGSDTYVVEGAMKYANAAFGDVTVYVMAANLRVS